MIQKNIMPSKLIADGNRHLHVAKLNSNEYQFSHYDDPKFPIYVDYAQREAQMAVIAQGFSLKGSLFINGHRNIKRKGKPDEWSYIAWFQKDAKGLVNLQCSVGFSQIGEQLDISISIPKSQMKRWKIERNK